MLTAECRSELNLFFTLHLSFFPSLLPAADCCASNLCSRFGMFFLSLWYFFCLDFLFSFSGGGFMFSVDQVRRDVLD